MNDKYGYIKHIKSGLFIKLEYIDSMGYTSAVSNIYKASIFTEKETNDFYFDDYFNRLLKNTSFTICEIDISNDELKFIECEIILKDNGR
jgi:hypothetical protein